MARLHAVEWGDRAGSPVVCLHGVTAHANRFRRLAEERLSDHRVVGLDLRGHGASLREAPWDVATHVADVVETVDDLGIGRAAWVGHSFGGRLVTELAARHPDRVERAVLLDPAMRIDPGLATERAAGMREEVSYGSPDEAIDARLGDGSLFTTPREALVEEADVHLERGDDGRWRWRFSTTAVIVAWSEMATAPPPYPAAPTLLVLGERSWLPPHEPDTAGLDVVRVPGGHVVLWDDFDLVADAVAAFLARAAPGRRTT